jgi:hypothetical protein
MRTLSTHDAMPISLFKTVVVVVTTLTVTKTLAVEAAATPKEKECSVKFATYNAYMNRNNTGQLVEELISGVSLCC